MQTRKINSDNCLIFKNLSPGEIDRLLNLSQAIQAPYRESSYIFYAGDTADYIYILEEGQVLVEKINASGKRLIMANFTETGSIFAEVFAFLEDKPLEYSCQAVEDSRLILLPRDFLAKISGQEDIYDRVLKNTLELLASKAYKLNKKIAIYSSYSLKAKIGKYILQVKEEEDLVDLHFNRDQLADYLGTTRPSLSRELMKMEEDGLIKVKGSLIRILDLGALEDLV